MIELISIGHVLKSHGVKGDLVVWIEQEYLPTLESCRALFFKINGNPVPYMILKRKDMGEQTSLLSLKKIDSRESSVALHGQDVMVNATELVRSQAMPEVDDLSGYTLIDQNGRHLTVQRMEEFPQQLMLICKLDNSEVLHIPLVEEWLEGIDPDEKIISMTLPDGI